ncbi:MAG: TIGR01440 family protein [Clostridia bacterium]|nr:TIGR01440 family protein [Clostridia bacterium]
MNNETVSIENTVEKTARDAAREISEAAGLREGSVLVVGCSSSEIGGGSIGHASSPSLAEAVYRGITSYTSEKGIFLAAQCCEHLNRALVIERELLSRLPLAEEVNVVPQPKAGGSFATAAYNNMKDPVMIEAISADAGLDIGSTLIGMHLKRVAVPVRLTVKQIGGAYVTAARVRPKFIGGCRAVYDDKKM